MPRHRSNHFQIASDDGKSYLAAADFFLFFSNPISLMILSVVRKKEMTAEEISKELGIGLNTALVKLNAMERKGILASRVRSQKTLYRIAELKILKAFDRILRRNLD
jgi:DNA-binding transcriptional ArsR family regulator